MVLCYQRERHRALVVVIVEWVDALQLGGANRIIRQRMHSHLYHASFFFSFFYSDSWGCC